MDFDSRVTKLLGCAKALHHFILMDLQLIFALAFFLILSVILYFKRDQIKTEGFFPIFYFSMLRTKLGLGKMKEYSKKYSKPLDIISKIGVFVGFLGMFLISGILVYYLVKTFTAPSGPAAVQVVLPFKVKGTFYVPFFYWLSCLTIIAFVHEFSHGVISKLRGVQIKSSGIAFMSLIVPIVPAAFVEPDEKKLKKKSKMDQLSVFAAGPFSNLILALIAFLVMILVLGPLNAQVYQPDGVLINSVQGNFSAQSAGVLSGEIITKIGNDSILKIADISSSLSDMKPGDTIELVTNRTSYSILLKPSPANASVPYIGLTLQEHYSLKKGLESLSWLFVGYDWIAGFFFWLFLLNFGVGLFNLAPLGIVDGGRMLQVGLYYIFPDDHDKADRIWKAISFFFIVIVVSLLIHGFIFSK